MAEKETKKNIGSNIPRGAKKSSVGGAKLTPRFNPIYFYVILAIAFFAIQYFTSSGTPIETSWQEVKKHYAEKRRRLKK